MTPQQYGPLIGIAVAVVIILLRNSKPRTLRPQFMWVAPLIVIVAIGFGLWGLTKSPGLSHAPFGVADWTVLAVALILGGAAGWWRGKMMTIEKHPDGTLKAQASPIGLILIVALLLGRRALSAFLEPHAASLGLSSLAVTDAFMILIVGMIVMQRIEMFIRARKVMAGGTDSHVEATA